MNQILQTPVALAGSAAVFPAEEFRARATALQARLRAEGADALLLTGPENIFWTAGRQTAGYFAFQALIMPAEGEPVLLVRQLEETGARADAWFDTIHTWQDGQDPAAALAALVRAQGIERLAVERSGWFVSPDMMGRIETALSGVSLLDGSGWTEALRAVKSPRELAALRLAAGYAEAGMAAAIEACRAGASENTIAAAMTAAAIEAGSEAMAMEPLVSSGPRSGIPHATWRRRLLEEGDGVFLELAASHDRYHAALMRSVWIGTPPETAQRMMDTALRGLDAALAAMRPGVACSVPHEAAQQVIDAAGFTAAFRKRAGYSMGAAFAPDWGEGAILSLFTGVETPLEPGMVFHLPITLRDYGRFTVGVSETVIVTETGAEPLSSLPRQITLR
ncbi:Xaa-Pro peptidase family protein [Salipiger sp. PrR002]|uniref:M24 family metallopeptidase n=1 Tax=Salipiger sp. PrR002 TaxID=2706489 RepID=UPI0013BB7BF4|nr:Xaa-Pro peptidase family protein [Salipiger sp. PrR002]NDW02640.1 aminopeptidase P family protein [Salipiger sp. PrR002]NDW59915.1 aminopeptidase P family protein [Salipiger sp. PrR004]